MLKKYEVTYPDEVLERLYRDFNSNNMGIYTFEEFCFIRYGQYISEFHFLERRHRTNLLFAHYA